MQRGHLTWHINPKPGRCGFPHMRWAIAVLVVLSLGCTIDPYPATEIVDGEEDISTQDAGDSASNSNSGDGTFMLDAGHIVDELDAGGGPPDPDTGDTASTSPSAETSSSTVDATTGESATCQVTSCAAAGAGCGFIDDGCGGQLDCGGCDTGEQCGIYEANQCAVPCADGCPTGYACNDDGICQGSVSTIVDVNVATGVPVTLTGQLTINGASPSDLDGAQSSCLTLHFRPTYAISHFDSVEVCAWNDWTYAVQTFSGLHEVLVQAMYPAPEAFDPLGQFNYSLGIVDVPPSGALDIDIPMAHKVPVVGEFRINGEAPSFGDGMSGSCVQITLGHAEAYDFEQTVSACADDGWTFSQEMWTGNYEATVSAAYQMYPSIPLIDLPVDDVIITDPSTNTVIDLQVPTPTVLTGELQVNGAAPTLIDDDYRWGINCVSVQFKSTDSSISMSTQACEEDSWAFEVPAWQGHYDVIVSNNNFNLLMPKTTNLEPITLTGSSTVVALNVTTPTPVEVSSQVTFDDGPPQTDLFMFGCLSISFRHLELDYFATGSTCPSTGWTTDIETFAGPHHIEVFAYYEGGRVVLQAFDSYNLSADTILPVFLTTPQKLMIAGNVTLNGSPPTTTSLVDEETDPYIRLTSASMTAVDVDASNGWAFETEALTGLLDVNVVNYSENIAMPRANLPADAIVLGPNDDNDNVNVNVTLPEPILVSGSVTVNDASPDAYEGYIGCLSVYFFHEVYSGTGVGQACWSNDWTFSVLAQPGINSVWVSPDASSSLPRHFRVIEEIDIQP